LFNENQVQPNLTAAAKVQPAILHSSELRVTWDGGAEMLKVGIVHDCTGTRSNQQGGASDFVQASQQLEMTSPLDMILQISLSLSKASDTDLMKSRLGWTVIAQLATQVDQHLVLRFIETQETHSLSGNPDTTIQVALHHLPVLPPPADNAAVSDDDKGGRLVHAGSDCHG
jgi:hypothetical protein